MIARAQRVRGRPDQAERTLAPALERTRGLSPGDRASLLGLAGRIALERGRRQEARRRLKAGGSLLLEHGYSQADAVAALLAAEGWTVTGCARDLGGLPRVTIAENQPGHSYILPTPGN